MLTTPFGAVFSALVFALSVIWLAGYILSLREIADGCPDGDVTVSWLDHGVAGMCVYNIAYLIYTFSAL